MMAMSPVAYSRPKRMAAPLPRLISEVWTLTRRAWASRRPSITRGLESVDPSSAMMISRSIPGSSTASTLPTTVWMVVSSLYTGMMTESFTRGSRRGS